MSLSHFSKYVSEAVVRAAGYHDAAYLDSVSEPGEPRERRLSIAISRETGTCGPIVARAVGAHLGWRVYDRELLELVARDLNVQAKLLENIDERHISWLQECVESFAAVPAVREGKFVQHLIKVLLSLAAQGQNVIVGRGGPFVLPFESTLRVRLMAPLEARIEVICRERKLPRAEAAQLVRFTDRARSEFVRLHFQRDPSDPRFYDLVLNTAQFSIEQCVKLIADALEAKSRGDATHAATSETAPVLANVG